MAKCRVLPGGVLEKGFDLALAFGGLCVRLVGGELSKFELLAFFRRGAGCLCGGVVVGLAVRCVCFLSFSAWTSMAVRSSCSLVSTL